MSTDVWFAETRPPHGRVLDENRLTVATTTAEDAERIVREHNAHEELLAALRHIEAAHSGLRPQCGCDAALGSREQVNPPDGSYHDERCHIAVILRARAAIAKAEGRS